MRGRITKNVSGVLKNIDFLAPHINLTIKGDSEVKTYTGAAFSFVAVSIFTALSIYTLKEAFRTDNPNVLVEYAFSRDYPKIDLLRSKQVPILLMTSSLGGVPAVDVRAFVHVRMVLRETRFSAEGQYSTAEIPIPLVPCAELGWDAIQEFSTPDSEPLEKLLVLTYGVCPNITGINLVVQGKLTSLLRHTLEITVYPCVPELLLPNQTCMTASQMSSTRLYLSQASLNLDLRNYKSPVSYSWDSENDFALNLGSHLTVVSRMKIVEVRNNEWGLYAESLVNSYAQVDQAKQNLFQRDPSQVSCSYAALISGSSCSPIATFTISSGSKREVYTRGYSGLLGVVGILGGIRALIFTLFFYFYGLFSSCTVKTRLTKLVAKELSNYENLVRNQHNSFCANPNNKAEGTSKTVDESSLSTDDKDHLDHFITKVLDIQHLVSKLVFLEDLMTYVMGLPPQEITNNNLQLLSPVRGELHSPDNLSKLPYSNSKLQTFSKLVTDRAEPPSQAKLLLKMDLETPKEAPADNKLGSPSCRSPEEGQPALRQRLQDSFLRHAITQHAALPKQFPPTTPSQQMGSPSRKLSMSPAARTPSKFEIKRVVPKLMLGKEIQSAVELDSGYDHGLREIGSASKGRAIFWRKPPAGNGKVVSGVSTPRMFLPKPT